MIPISREAVQKSVQDISSSLQSSLVQKLIEDTNQGISDAVIRNMKSYSVQVPAVVFGLPAYNARDIASTIKDMYGKRGFQTSLKKNVVTLSW
jgi:hypothetical protein